MPYITFNEQKLFYAHQRAATNVPALVLVHGAGGSHLDWPAELRRLPETAVYALDLPGHGRSAPPGCSNIGDYAKNVLDFLETLHLQNVFLVGHSMGGAIVQTVGLQNSPRVAGLVLVGTGARLRVADEILGKLQTETETAVSTIVRYYWSEAAPPEVLARSRQNLLQNEPVTLCNDFAACHQFDIRSQLASIQHPTLVISATDDQLTPPKYGRFLAEALPHAQFVLIPNAAHMLMLERPKAVANVITQFISNQVAE